MAQTVKNLSAMWETWFNPWIGKIPLEEGGHSSILAFRIPWTEEPGGYNPWDHKELNRTDQLTL